MQTSLYLVPSPRDDLLDQVRLGNISPQQAEDDAAKLGLEPFTTRPDPKDFDPRHEAMWTLPMALAWIIWRSPDPVREMWDLFRDKFRFWLPQDWQVPGQPKMHGHILEGKEPAGLWDVMFELQQQPAVSPGVASWSDACRLLRIEAQRGALIVRGLPTAGGPPKIIPSVEWDDLEVTEIRKRSVLRFKSYDFPNVGYNNILLGQADLKKIFTTNFESSGAITPWAGAPLEPIDEAQHPFPDFSRTTLIEAVKLVVERLFPDGLPPGMSVKERNTQIGDAIEAACGRRPSTRTFQRALRTLK